MIQLINPLPLAFDCEKDNPHNGVEVPATHRNSNKARRVPGRRAAQCRDLRPCGDRTAFT